MIVQLILFCLILPIALSADPPSSAFPSSSAPFSMPSTPYAMPSNTPTMYIPFPIPSGIPGAGGRNLQFTTEFRIKVLSKMKYKTILKLNDPIFSVFIMIEITNYLIHLTCPKMDNLDMFITFYNTLNHNNLCLFKIN